MTTASCLQHMRPDSRVEQWVEVPWTPDAPSPPGPDQDNTPTGAPGGPTHETVLRWVLPSKPAECSRGLGTARPPDGQQLRPPPPPDPGRVPPDTLTRGGRRAHGNARPLPNALQRAWRGRVCPMRTPCGPRGCRPVRLRHIWAAGSPQTSKTSQKCSRFRKSRPVTGTAEHSKQQQVRRDHGAKVTRVSHLGFTTNQTCPVRTCGASLKWRKQNSPTASNRFCRCSGTSPPPPPPSSASLGTL